MDLLSGTVQHYAWGDRAAIAELRGRPPSGNPEAELWFGAHPLAPSRLRSIDRSLLDAVEDDPPALLGAGTADRFGRFPFLLKVLAAGQPLSIQAHPSLEAARTGFAREEAKGIPRDAPTRTYRDDNHKPELICALTPFEAKCGFRHPSATVAAIDELLCRAAAGATSNRDGERLLVELGRRLLADDSPADAIVDALDWILHLPAEHVRSVVDRLLEAASGCELSSGDEASWLAELHRHHPHDRGIIVSLLLNHVSLAPGDAMFLPAGNLHSYLRGVGVELMANSDNVVRGGLTTKHIDVDELLAIVDPVPGPPPIERPSELDHRYCAPVPEFSLTRLAGGGTTPDGERRFEPIGPDIVLVTSGAAWLEPLDSARGGGVRVTAGDAAFVAPVDGPYAAALDDGSIAWRATIGEESAGAGPDRR